jgi:RND superfamily putative drug exporter
MHLLGCANWWLPDWIDSRPPHLSVEPADEQTPDPAPREPLHIGTP